MATKSGEINGVRIFAIKYSKAKFYDTSMYVVRIIFISLQNMQQECIPVGCVTPAC